MLTAAIVTTALAGLLAALSAAAFLWAPHGSPQRMLAAARATAAVILVPGVLGALFGSTTIGLVGLVICGVVAAATVGAAAWQVARYAAAAQHVSSTGGCGSTCAGCPSANSADASVCARP